MQFFGADKDLFKYTRNGKPVLFAAVNGNHICVDCVFICRYILADSQDGLICEQQQKSVPAHSALGEALGLSFSEVHGK